MTQESVLPRIAFLFAVVFIVGGCIHAPTGSQVTAPADSRAVAAPRAWLDAGDALDLACSAGQHYAVTAGRVDGLMGPLTVDRSVSPGELIRLAAKAAGLQLSWSGSTIVLQPELNAERRLSLKTALANVSSTNDAVRRQAAYDLGQSARLEAIPLLSRALADPTRSVRRTALLALASFEGDFDHEQRRGRLSIFELPTSRLDVDTLLWIIEETAPAGGDEWNAAVSLLARARESQLSRVIWHHPWNRTPGAIVPAIRAVGRCGDPSVGKMLEKRIRNTFTGNPADRFVVAAAMGKLEMARSLNEHANPKAESSQPPEVRCAAVYGLGFCGHKPGAMDALKAALSDPDSRVREIAAFSLGRLDTADSLNALSAVLSDDKADVALRAAAASALSRASGRRGLKPLLDAMQSPDSRVRAIAAEFLGDLGGREAQNTLAACINDAAPSVVAAAGRAFASIGKFADACVDPWAGFGKILTDHKADLDTRIAIAIGLGQGRDPAAAQPLKVVFLDPAANHRLRKYAACALARLANRAGQPVLRQFLETGLSAKGLNLVAIRFLDLADPAATTSYLARYLNTGSRDEQVMAAERIAELGTPEGVRLLAAGFSSYDNHTRFTQVWALMIASEPRVEDTLVDLLRTGIRSGIRMNAALALSGRRNPAAIDALIAATNDRSSGVAKGAVNSLGECGDPAAADALVQCIEKSPDIGVTHQAIRALRMREFANLPEVKAAFLRVRGTERDAGIPGGPSVDQQPANSWVCRRWQSEFDDDGIPNLTYESAIVYDPVQGRIVQWGAHGRRADFPQTGFTWLYDTAANEWRRPESRQEPPGICLTRGLTADPVRGLVISPSGAGGGHGWVMALRKHLCYAVPWLFNVRSEQWTPSSSTFHPGNATEGTSCFDWKHDVMLLDHRPLIYDPHVNQWIRQPPRGEFPQKVNNSPGAYDPVTGRFIMVAGQDDRGLARTWAYDLAANAWTDLAPSNPPPAVSHTPMVYDSVNDVFLLFRRAENRIAVHVLHPRRNEWEELPAVFPCPHYGQFDTAYDPRNNVTVMCGGWEFGQSGAVTTRETWTYRYRQAPSNAPLQLGPPETFDWTVQENSVGLSWTKPASGEPSGYNVYRGVGDRPWTAVFTRLTEKPIQTTIFSDAETPQADAFRYYRVCAVNADGKEGLPSRLVRTRPEVVREIFCARDSKGSVRIAWTPSPSPGVAGYNVYRAPGEQADFWIDTFDPEKNDKKDNKLVRLTAHPVRETSFTDNPPAAESRATSESDWAPLYVYVVKAVNVFGQESGASPATLSIPAAPGPVMVVPLEDSRCMVVSGDAGPLTGMERGRQCYRMDFYEKDWVFRSRGIALPGSVFVDDQAWPNGDRRAYFVVAVDGSGQLGAPSTEAWAINPP